jgi:hypothetical protein
MASYTSSMHLSRSFSPVWVAETPSLFIVRVLALAPAAVGVLGVAGAAAPFAAALFFRTVQNELRCVQNAKVDDAPAVFTPTTGFAAGPGAAPPAAAFACSTSFFHCLTISFARSETSLDECVRSLPTASPALLSYPSRCISVSPAKKKRKEAGDAPGVSPH